jgi:copper chaperone CopZ
MTTQQSRLEPIQFIDLGVGRMTCDDCVRTVTAALESVPGVQGAEVSLDDRSARVTADPSVDTTELTAAVRASGYNAFVRANRTPA